MLSRRAMVGRLAAGTVAVCAAGAAKATFAATRDSNVGGTLGQDATVTASTAGAATATEPAPWELLSPLAQGAEVGHGWRLSDLTAIENGSCVLTLENQRGRAHRVHVCGNAGQPQGLVYTNRMELFVMNGGQGDLPTEEGLAQAVAVVAHVLAANEDRHQVMLTALLPHAERVQRYTDAAQLR